MESIRIKLNGKPMSVEELAAADNAAGGVKEAGKMESMLIMQNVKNPKSSEEGRVEGLVAAGNAAGGVVENKCDPGKCDYDVYETEKELIDIVMHKYKTKELKIAALAEMRSRHRKDAVISATLTPMGAALTSGLIAEARTWGAAAILAIPMIICTGAFTGAFLSDVFKFARLARLDTEAIKKVKGSSYDSFRDIITSTY